MELIKSKISNTADWITNGRQMIEKYDDPELLLHVEYPSKNYWDIQGDDKIYRKELINNFSKKEDGTIIYIHIPFCTQLCYYCKCVKEITHDYNKIINYLKVLESEIQLFKNFIIDNNLNLNVKEIYMGGGSPTILKENEFTHLVNTLRKFVDIPKLNRFFIEIDPRTVTKEKLEYYKDKGVTTISLGIQDFNPVVQKNVNRIQPYEMVKDLMVTARKLFNSINFDLIVGLPYQTPETIKETINKVILLSPDRISMDYYSHGDLKYYPHTSIINDVAVGSYERHVLFNIIIKKLEDGGYLRTGAGYFAKPSDIVGKAFKNKKANFMQFGVIANKYSGFIGFGRSASGNLGGKTGWRFMYQNYYEFEQYEEAIKAGKFPIYRYYKSSDDEEIRGIIIKTLRSYFIVNKKEIEKEYKLNFSEYFSKELNELEEFEKDGLCKITKNKIILTEIGKHFSEVIASVFDIHSKNPKFKSII